MGSHHPFRDTDQWKQVYGNQFGPPIGRAGNGLGDVWGGEGEDGATRRPRPTTRPKHFEDDHVEEPEIGFAEIEWAIDLLSPKQAFVIRLRFGLQDGYAYTLNEIADLMGVSHESVRRLQKRAIRRLHFIVEGGGDDQS
jgi:RNA polymerase sigma factor (sigma-70 family)